MSSTLAQALDLLGIGDDEALSALSQTPGAPARGSRVRASRVRASRWPDGRNYWLGLCPIDPDGPGRGTARDVRRVPALWADLDVKAGGLPSMAVAEAVISDLATILGSEPVYVTMTGHGVQPVWAIEPDDSHDVARATTLLRRWGLLVRIVARAHGGDVDHVYDVARVLRVPGSTNVKDPQAPVPTSWETRPGRPVSLDELADALDAHAVPELDEQEATGEPSPAGSWPWAESTCAYVRAMIAGWATAAPSARHPWIVGQAVRLACAHRLGCLTQQDHEAALDALQARSDALRAHDGRRPEEVRGDALPWAVALVELKTHDDCRHELGDHAHDRAEPSLIDVEQEAPEERDRRRGYIDWPTLWADETAEREYLIPGVWTCGAGGSIYSPAGAGKSLLGLEWSACLALGLPILGEPIKARTVLYLDLENDEHLVRERLEALGLAGYTIPDLHYSLLGDWSPLDTAQGGRELVDEACRLGADLVVIDTTSRVISGEENSADTFHALYRHTLMPLKAAGIATMRLDHAGKDLAKGERGSSAKRGDVDLTYRLTLASETTVALKREKNRLHLPGPEVLMLRRTDEPLRHELLNVDQARERRLADLIETLDRLGVPADAGRPTARAALKADGQRATDRDLSTAQTRRRLNRPDPGCASPAPLRVPVPRTVAAHSGSHSNAQPTHSPRTAGEQLSADGRKRPFAQRSHSEPPPDCRSCGLPMPHGDVMGDGLHPACADPEATS